MHKGGNQISRRQNSGWLNSDSGKPGKVFKSYQNRCSSRTRIPTPNHVETQNAALRRRNSAFRRRTNTYAKKCKAGLQRTLDVHPIIFVRPHWTTGKVPAVALAIIALCQCPLEGLLDATFFQVTTQCEAFLAELARIGPEPLLGVGKGVCAVSGCSSLRSSPGRSCTIWDFGTGLTSFDRLK